MIGKLYVQHYKLEENDDLPDQALIPWCGTWDNKSIEKKLNHISSYAKTCPWLQKQQNYPNSLWHRICLNSFAFPRLLL